MSRLIPDMEILLAGGATKAAKDLEVGDKLETLHQHTLEKGEHEVTYVRVIESPLLSLNFLGKAFTCSEEDLFYSTNKKGWLKATELKEGDKISQLKGELEFQSSKKLGKGPSVELTVDEAHTYVCDEVLLHNKGGSSPPPPPPPKRYTQKEVDNMKKQWRKDRQAEYDKRYAGDKKLWEAQRDRDKAIWERDYSTQQRDLYDQRFTTAKADWHTAAEQRYDERLGRRKKDWHSAAETRYDKRFGEARTKWQSAADEAAAKRKAAWDTKFGEQEAAWGKKLGGVEQAWGKKYGDLDVRYKQQGKEYDEKLKKSELSFRHENQSRLNLLDRFNTLEGKYDTRDREYGDLQKRFMKRGQQYDTLEGRYGDLTGKYGDLEGRYRKRGREYDTLSQKYESRDRDYNTLRGNYDTLEGRYRGAQGDSDRYKRQYQRSQADRRRQSYGGRAPSPAEQAGLDSDAERQALLTGDYSALNKRYDRYRR